jgi:hypothetical protein
VWIHPQIIAVKAWITMPNPRPSVAHLEIAWKVPPSPGPVGINMFRGEPWEVGKSGCLSVESQGVFRFLMLFGLKYAKKNHHLYHLGSSGIGCPKGAPTNLCFILIGPLETATGGISKFQTSPYPICLVGGAITILKNHGVRQWVSDDIPYMKWKKKIETTNQL